MKLKHDMPMSFTEKLGAAVHDVRRPDWGAGRITRTDAGGAYPVTVVFDHCVNYYTPDGRDNQYADKVVLVEVFEPAVSDNTPQISPDSATVRPAAEPLRELAESAQIIPAAPRPFQVGDKVVDTEAPQWGVGVVTSIGGGIYPVRVDLPCLPEARTYLQYMADGRYWREDIEPRLKHVNP